MKITIPDCVNNNNNSNSMDKNTDEDEHGHPLVDHYHNVGLI